MNTVDIEQLCEWAARLGAVVVTVRELPGAGIAQAHTSNCTTLTLPEFDS
jgi:hypothetical protein